MINTLISDPHQRRLLKKWGMVLESGKKIQNESTKIMLAQLLENTRNYYKMTGILNEAGITHASTVGTRGEKGGVLTGKTGRDNMGSATDYGDFYLPKVVFPMLRRIMPDLIANDLVDVQPLNGPVGYALAFRPMYNDNGEVGKGTLNTIKNKEIGYAPTDTRYTGVQSDKSEVNGTNNDNEYWKAYAGQDDNAWSGIGQEVGAGEYARLGNPGEAGTYPTITFGLIKQAVEAKTRKLAANWSPELAEDMQAMHGIDVEREMVNTLTYEIGAEIDRQIVNEMVRAAIVGGSTTEWSPVTADGLDQMGRMATLLTQIAVEGQQISLRTRRGAANFVVTTPRICALLQQMGLNKYTSFKSTDQIPSTPDNGVGALSKVGLVNDDTMLLVRDAYAPSDYVLLGYKGKQKGDSGIIYCPYIPLQLAKVVQPGTFTPSIGARTRYGLLDSPWESKNFYAFIKIDKLDGKYEWNEKRQFITKPSTVAETTFKPVEPTVGP